MNHGHDRSYSVGTVFRQISKSQKGGPAPAGGAESSGVNPSFPAQPSTCLKSVVNQCCHSVLVADDQPVMLAGISALLGTESDMQVVGNAGNGREAVEKFLQRRPDVGLFELRMPVMDGIDAVAAILEKVPLARIVIFTAYQSEEDVYRAIRAGAQGYIFKNSPVQELMESIRAVAAGRKWIPPLVAAKLARRITDRELTLRETEVMRAISSGKSNKEIGSALNISEGTVKVHVTHILEKLKASGRTEAIRVALERGIVCLNEPMAA